LELDEVRWDEQLAWIADVRDVTVVLSAKRRKIVGFVEFDWKAAVIRVPPTRLVLSGLPYSSLSYK